MSISLLLRRGLLAAALTVALSGASIAGETLQTETRVQLRTTAGQIESLLLDELAVGEVKALRADSGTTVIASRGADGYLLEVGTEEFKLPDFDSEMLAFHGTGKHVELHRHGGHGGHAVEKRVIVRDGADAKALAHAEAHASAGGDDTRKIVVVRKHADGADVDVEVGAEGLAALADLESNPPSLADPGNEGKRILVTRRVHHEKVDSAPEQ